MGIITVVAVSVMFYLGIGKKSDLFLASLADRLSFQRLIEDKGITKRSLGNSAISMAESQKPQKGIEFFWDSFDFSHKSYVAQPELLKQPAINFINIRASQKLRYFKIFRNCYSFGNGGVFVFVRCWSRKTPC